MSYRQQSKKAKFAHRAKRHRLTHAIMKENLNKPGFLGAAHNVKVSVQGGGPTYYLGSGALFIGRKRSV